MKSTNNAKSSGSFWTPLAIGGANLVIALALYETAGWHYIRGYNEVTNFLIFPPILAQAAVNLAIAFGVLFHSMAESAPRWWTAIAYFATCSVGVAISLLVAPQVGRFLNRQLLLPTPLIEAARYGDADVVMAKVNRGADPDVRHQALDITPLHCMASSGKAEAVELLLRKGADPNAQSRPSKETPLYLAVRDHVDVPTIQLLINYGADPNLVDWEGHTPVTLANSMPEPQCSRILAIFGRQPIREAPQVASP